MVTPFQTTDDALSSAIDTEFGETFTFSARKIAVSGDVNLPNVADATKPDFQCVGVWEAIGQSQFPRARGSVSDDDAASYAATYPSVSVADSALTWRPQKGARCTRAFDGALYEVAKVLPDNMGRTLFFLSSKAA